MWARRSVILIYIYYNIILCEHVEVLFYNIHLLQHNIVWALWKCYFNIHLLQHNIVWACVSDILIYIYYNAILLITWTCYFGTINATQYWVSMWKCYFNIYSLQHNIVWACGSVILIYIYYNTILCEHVEVFILIYIYYNAILCEHCGSVILIYIYYNTILCDHVEVLF